MNQDSSYNKALRSAPVPLLMWWDAAPEIKLRGPPPRKYDWLICGCSDPAVHDLLENKEAELARDDVPGPFKDLLLLVGEEKVADFSTCGFAGRQLIERCVDYLSFQSAGSSHCEVEYCLFLSILSLKGDKPVPRCIKDFISEFLEVGAGYDYLLLNLLEKYKFMEHGCSIRRGWLKQ